MTASAGRVGPGVVVAAFAASRLAFFAAGVRFDTAMLHDGAQVIDVALLRNDLWRSLWHLHAQPPLFNLLLGGALQLFGDGFAPVLQAAWLALALAAYLAMFGLLRRMGVAPAWSAALVVAFMVGAPAVLYENWLFYTGPVAWLLVLAAYALIRFLDDGGSGAAFACFALAGAVVLTRSTFHLMWLLTLVALVLAARPRRWRTTMLAALLPCALAAGLYAKNQAMFGGFAASSWMGFSVAKLAVKHIPPDDRQALVARGVLSPLAMTSAIMAGVAEYEALLGPAATTGVPALDRGVKSSGQPNFNHAIYPRASAVLLHDSVQALRHYPKAMAWAVLKASYFYALAASDYDYYLDGNRRAIAGWEAATDLAFHARPPRAAIAAAAGLPADDAWVEWAQRISPTVILALALVLAGGLPTMLRLVRQGLRGSPADVTLAFLWITIAYFSLLCVTLEVYENNRIRFEIEPLLLVAAAVVARRLFRRA